MPDFKRSLAFRAAAGALGVLGCGVVGACGDAGNSHSSKRAAVQAQTSSAQPSVATERARALAESTSQLAPPGKIAPSTVLAHVGAVSITFATVEHQMVLRSSQTPLPDPPDYTSCIARFRAAPRAGAAGQSEAVLKQGCQQSYEGLLQVALGASIHNQWLIQEAADEGARVSPREVHEEFDASKHQFRTEAEFASYRKSTGQTIADMLYELKLGKLTDRIFQNVKKKEHPVTAAEVSAYYHAHPEKFMIPAGRDVQILRTTTEASALRAKQKIQGGRSFKSIVEELSTVAQPITAKNGEVKDLIPHLFEEKKLNDAIFQAQPHRLYGPITIVESHQTIAPESGSGSYIFEVRRVIPARAIPLSRVKATIVGELAKSEKESALSAAVAAFKAKWRSKTDCAPGFIVKNCRQYSGSEKGVSAGDAYTF